jgi:hypothetical protein
MQTITYVGKLVTTSCWCGIHLAIPEDLYRIARRNKGKAVWCPLGHEFIFSNTTEEQLAQARKEAADARRREEATRSLLQHEERSHAATRGHVTRKKKELSRVKAGICPCCTRHFVNLERHMATKHKGYTP